jgi:hypothetical protein
VEQLPGLQAGREELEQALRLISSPTEPGALTAARSAVRRALRVIPQSCPDQLCYEERWRSRNHWNGPRDVCSRPTCGRCLPLKAAIDREAPA